MANSYLTRTVSSTGNRRTFTISTWFKRSGITGANQKIFEAVVDGSSYTDLRLKTTEALQFYTEQAGISKISLVTNRLFRDPNAWYHVVIAVDTTQGTASDRVKMYINGVQETSFSTATYPDQNYDTYVNYSSATNVIGRRNPYSDFYFDGYLSHLSLVDGTALAPTVFGSTDSTSGIWKFKSPSGVTWGTNGFHLKFENSGALGTDSSGNSNTFTVNGNLKQAVDTPSNVYSTINPLSQKDPTVTYAYGNNRIFFNQTSWFAVYSTLAASSGKWYAECKINQVGAESSVGIISVDTANFRQKSVNDYLGKETDSIGYLQNGEIKKANSNQQTGLTSFSNGTIVGIAMDLDNNTVQFYINGASTGNTVSLTADKDYYFGTSGYTDAEHQWNFGNGLFGTTAITSAGSNGNGSLFEYDVPSGFYALNTKNINTYG